MYVVATAGHVDHGKSTLLQALTGKDPDRLAEEKKRGLSIELGYVWCDVEGVGEVAFIDVPGHQKFVATALSGLGQVPVALFVVAADDPWMPQATEHLHALHALGVDRGVLVVTRADLADPAPILAQARERLRGTSLAGIPEVVVSARTGDGLALLTATLADVLGHVPAPREEPAVRLWIDRHFNLKGSGTVVTGTLESGMVTVGDELEAHLADGLHSVRIRSIESLGQRHDTISGTARVALELAGRAARDLQRGQALATPGTYAYTDTVDVRLIAADAQHEQRLPRTPILHFRSASHEVRLRALTERYARLTLPRPLPLKVGDRALLRDPGSRTIWGFDVVDPAPAPSAGRGFAERRAAELDRFDLTVGADLEFRGIARWADYEHWFGTPVDFPGDAVIVDEWVLSARRAADVAPDLLRLVSEASAAPTLASAARSLELPEAVVAHLAPTSVRVEHGRWVRADLTPALSPEDQAAIDALAEFLGGSPFEAPDKPTLATMGLDERRVARLHKSGHLLRVAPGVVLLPGADEEALATLADLEQPFTTSAARGHLQANRRTTLGLLDHLDRTGRTVRLPDDTRRLRP